MATIAMTITDTTAVEIFNFGGAVHAHPSTQTGIEPIFVHMEDRQSRFVVHIFLQWFIQKNRDSPIEPARKKKIPSHKNEIIHTTQNDRAPQDYVRRRR